MMKQWIDIDFLEENGPGLVCLNHLKDERGFFGRVFCDDTISNHLPFKGVKQVNMSFSENKGTVRGLHYQKSPFLEAKILFCLSGKISDYILDLRHESEHYGRVYKIRLDNEETGVFVPRGFAHGFQTLESNTRILYFHDQVYSGDHEAGYSIFSESLSIEFDIPVKLISNRDRDFPLFKG